MHKLQPAVLESPSRVACSLTFRHGKESTGEGIAAALRRLQAGLTLNEAVVGIGESVARALDKSIAGLRTFPALSGVGCDVPSTQGALWLLLRGQDASELFDARTRVLTALQNTFALDDAMDLFVYRESQDLSGYVDGTENPKAEKALSTVRATGPTGVADGTFVAVQRWEHDLVKFRGLSTQARDHMMGRSLATNEELSDAPASAHVKRAAQESFEPEAFMLRRSMPWVAAHTQGLEFIAYGASVDAYERVLNRMLGREDGVRDGLFSFSRPITGGFYFCPPTHGAHIDLRALGL